jgi:hypothetical protein
MRRLHGFVEAGTNYLLLEGFKDFQHTEEDYFKTAFDLIVESDGTEQSLNVVLTPNHKEVFDELTFIRGQYIRFMAELGQGNFRWAESTKLVKDSPHVDIDHALWKSIHLWGSKYNLSPDEAEGKFLVVHRKDYQEVLQRLLLTWIVKHHAWVFFQEAKVSVQSNVSTFSKVDRKHEVTATMIAFFNAGIPLSKLPQYRKTDP